MSYKTDIHHVTIEESCKSLKVDLDKGLCDAEVHSRREIHGSNAVESPTVALSTRILEIITSSTAWQQILFSFLCSCTATFSTKEKERREFVPKQQHKFSIFSVNLLNCPRALAKCAHGLSYLMKSILLDLRIPRRNVFVFTFDHTFRTRKKIGRAPRSSTEKV